MDRCCHDSILSRTGVSGCIIHLSVIPKIPPWREELYQDAREEHRAQFWSLLCIKMAERFIMDYQEIFHENINKMNFKQNEISKFSLILRRLRVYVRVCVRACVRAWCVRACAQIHMYNLN